ncbi:MAG TPA: FAD-binding oxidoreductase [Ktedonobacterales bacterium]|nr:FAD-binding oxidoreductase [Ktedonobacterales bacterium]
MMGHEADHSLALGEATIQDFRASLRGQLILPGDAAYDDARKVWNGMIDRRPALIVRCAGVADVSKAIRFARDQQLLVAVRGGSHNVTGAGTCDGGLVIDLSPMKVVQVDSERHTARVEPGTTWKEFDQEAQQYGLATTGGLISSTGVAGFTLGGGIGWLVRKHGLACDNLLSAEVVTADGQLVKTSTDEHPDLYWGLRGGGGNFGVVTAFEFALHPVSTVVGGVVAYPLARAREVLHFYRRFLATAPDELTTIMIFATTPEGQQIIGIAACYAGPVEQGEAVLRPLKEFGPSVMDMMGPLPYTALQQANDPTAPAGLHNYWKAAFLHDLSDAAMDTMIEYATKATSPLSMIHLHQLGGAMNRVAADATAFGYRNEGFVVNIIGMWPTPGDNEHHINWARGLFAALQPEAHGAYVNFLGDEGQGRVRSAYGPNYERLVALKRKYDPANLFRLNQNIRPD